MESNLDSLFKTDKALEQQGITLEFGPAKFQVKRFGGWNSQHVKAAMAKYYKPHARSAENGTLTQEQEQTILVKTFVYSSMVGWSGVVIDKVEQEYSPENAIALFLELPELFKAVQEQAADVSNFKEDAGNI